MIHDSNAMNSDAAVEGFISFLPNSAIGTTHVSMSSVSPATTG